MQYHLHPLYESVWFDPPPAYYWLRNLIYTHTRLILHVFIVICIAYEPNVLSSALNTYVLFEIWPKFVHRHSNISFTWMSRNQWAPIFFFFFKNRFFLDRYNDKYMFYTNIFVEIVTYERKKNPDRLGLVSISAHVFNSGVHSDSYWRR